MMNLFGLCTFLGCWKDFESLPQIDINQLPFENENLMVSDVYIATLESNLTCPDGENAPIFVVYPLSETPLPVVIVFHSNSIAYITDFERNQAQLPQRFQSTWAKNKLWETFGMSNTPQDLYEDNQGYLPTALSNAGYVQIYPGNCWGDYWHNDLETYPNAEYLALLSSQEDTASETEYFDEFGRQGRLMARSILQSLSDPLFSDEFGLRFPQAIDATEQHWIGLGAGGRAILELLALPSTADNPPASVIFDGTPFDLQPYLEDPTAFELEVGTLSKVFIGEEGYPLSDLSTFSWRSINYPEKVGILWSNGDTKLPQESFQEALEGIEAPFIWKQDSNIGGNVFSNRDWILAQQLVQFIQTGDPTIPEENSSEENTEEENPPSENTEIE